MHFQSNACGQHSRSSECIHYFGASAVASSCTAATTSSRSPSLPSQIRAQRAEQRASDLQRQNADLAERLSAVQGVGKGKEGEAKEEEETAAKLKQRVYQARWPLTSSNGWCTLQQPV